jgi:peptidoglycan/xylan/chitin deacetylase (PgdA/CDA1 family)
VRKKLLILLLIVLGLALIWQLSRSRTTQLFGNIVNRVDTTEKVVALTFDDGPMPTQTQMILRILKENDVKASFFLVGEAVRAHPEETEMIIQAGHEVGNHSYTHQKMVLKSPAFVSLELKKTEDALRKAGAEGPIHFRPPYGKKLVVLPYYLWKNDILSVTWDVEPESYSQTSKNSLKISQHVVNSVKPGSIVLLHVMFNSREASMNAVPEIIQELKVKGYRFVTVSELLEYHESS